MIVRVPDIPSEGLTVADTAELGPVYSDPTWRLDAVRLRVERDSLDVFVTGEISATVPLVCGRCLEPSPVEVKAAVDVRLAPRPATGDSVELAADDLDVDFYAKDELNVATLIETETTLALPMKPLCREGCRGLCPVCGGNRNVVLCACQPSPPDRRPAGLKDLAARLPH